MTTGTVYIIKPRDESGVTCEPRLVKAERRHQVEPFLLGAFSIEKATMEEACELASKGVRIVDAQP